MWRIRFTCEIRDGGHRLHPMSGARLVVRVGLCLAFAGAAPGHVTFLSALEASLIYLVLLEGRLTNFPCRGL